MMSNEYIAYALQSNRQYSGVFFCFQDKRLVADASFHFYSLRRDQSDLVSNC